MLNNILQIICISVYVAMAAFVLKYSFFGEEKNDSN
jgi:hypothetical protein